MERQVDFAKRTVQARTRRLIVRPLGIEDYEVWKAGVAGRTAPRRKHDAGPLPSAMLTKDVAVSV